MPYFIFINFKLVLIDFRSTKFKWFVFFFFVFKHLNFLSYQSWDLLVSLTFINFIISYIIIINLSLFFFFVFSFRSYNQISTSFMTGTFSIFFTRLMRFDFVLFSVSYFYTSLGGRAHSAHHIFVSCISLQIVY